MRMSQNPGDFGAKSVLRAHLLKKEYISAPYDFRHVAHFGLDMLDLPPVENQDRNKDDKKDDHLSGVTLRTQPDVLKPSQSEPKNLVKYNIPIVGVKSAKGYLRRSISERGYRQITKADISDPYDFMHVAHVGLDDILFIKEVESSDVLKEFLKKAGVTEKQLKDPKTRRFIYDFIKSNGGTEAIKGEQNHSRPSKAATIEDINSRPAQFSDTTFLRNGNYATMGGSLRNKPGMPIQKEYIRRASTATTETLGSYRTVNYANIAPNDSNNSVEYALISEFGLNMKISNRPIPPKKPPRLGLMAQQIQFNSLQRNVQK